MDHANHDNPHNSRPTSGNSRPMSTGWHNDEATMSPIGPKDAADAPYESVPRQDSQKRPGTKKRGPTLRQRADQVGKAVQSAYHAVEAYFRTLQEKRRHAAAMELIGEMSGKYRGKTKPATKIDRLTRLDVPTWSTSLYNPMANTSMLMCAATGFGLCVIHGHTQDALTGGGCCFSCCTCCLSCNECGRQRRYMRKRFNMPGGDYYLDGWPGDCCEATCMTPLTVLQEAREVEIRTRRRWDYVRGFRGVGEDIGVAICGEETLENVLIPYVPKERDVLAMTDEDDDDSEAGSGGELRPPEHVSVMSR